MRQLNAGSRTLHMQKSHDALQHRNMRILPNAQIGWRDTPLGRHRRRFRDHQPRTALGSAAEMDKVPVIGKSILARVLAHG